MVISGSRLSDPKISWDKKRNNNNNRKENNLIRQPVERSFPAQIF